MSEDIEPVLLSDGTRVALVRSGADEGLVKVQLVRGDRVVGEAALPYPAAGLAGGRFIVSSSEQLLVLSMFSGQSEEGYEVFRLGTGITKVARLPYQFGETASFCFTADESVLLMALPFTCTEWWLLWEDGEVEPDPAGRSVFVFGQLRMHHIASGAISVHELRVSVSATWQPSRAEYDPDLHPRFVAENSLALAMPWGEVAVPLPLSEVVTLVVDR